MTLPLTWREGFLIQARSDDRVRRLLAASSVEYSHRLHYLQMVCEKVAKGLLASVNNDIPPPMEHSVFVRLLQVVKGRPDFRRRFGYKDAKAFRQSIDALLPLAVEVERLAPSSARLNAANPEYPWLDRNAGVTVPAQFGFPAFDPRSPRMIRQEAVLTRLLESA